MTSWRWNWRQNAVSRSSTGISEGWSELFLSRTDARPQVLLPAVELLQLRAQFLEPFQFPADEAGVGSDGRAQLVVGRLELLQHLLGQTHFEAVAKLLHLLVQVLLRLRTPA